jgi:hypothetical protein
MNTKQNLNEAFVVSKRTDERGNLVAYIDPNKPENRETFKYKNIFSKYGAKWSPAGKYWFWYIGKTKDQWQKVYKSFIEPALKEVHKLEGAPEEESQASMVASLEAVISDIESQPTSNTDDELMTPEKKTQLVDRLAKFKETIINLDSDEEFKETMRIITNFRNSQGHQYSLFNTFMIWVQNPKATFVMSEIRWNKYNRTVNPEAKKDKKIWIVSPSKSAMIPYSKEEKEQITNKYIRDLGKKSYNDLSIGEKDKLGVALRGKFGGNRFDYTAAYDIADTTQMEGKEDLTGDYQKNREIKWYEDNAISDEVKPVYNALMEFASEKGIKIDLVDPEKMGGARGVSKSGEIGILKNEGNDVGLTKTLAHEISHELLHQKYLSDKNPEMKQFFVGQSEGRDLVEQQAELSAWMVMASFGFDLKTTSLNYVAIWGADKNAMIKVFDTVTNVVNYLIDYINAHIGQGTQSVNPTGLTEEAVATHAEHITPMDIANVLGVTSEYQQELKKQQMVERYTKLVRK